MSSRTLAASRALGRVGRPLVSVRTAYTRTLNYRPPWIRGDSDKAEMPRKSLFNPGQVDAMKRSSFGINDQFPKRHIGPDMDQVQKMINVLDPPLDGPSANLTGLIAQVIPPDVLTKPEGRFVTMKGESDALKTIARETQSVKNIPNFIGKGYYQTITPEVIKRNIVENPAWYTSYTPYQAEISQGRLESLLNFQTMVSDLTGLPVANASLLDEGTAAAEAMTLSLNSLPASRAKRPGRTMLVAKGVYEKTVDVMKGRAEGFGIKIESIQIPSQHFFERLDELGDDLVGVMVQYPDRDGRLTDYREVANRVHEKGALLSCATELLALTLFTPPGEWGADIAFGSSQRFGVPLGGGGPHAAFFAVTEKHKRKLPGRLVGVSKDRMGGRALRLALQTREQHIRREKATSNVCTAQALPANVAAMYAVYHGPEQLKSIAEGIMRMTRFIQKELQRLGFNVPDNYLIDGEYVGWDTVVVDLPSAKSVAQVRNTCNRDFHFRSHKPPGRISFTVGEGITLREVFKLLDCMSSWATPDARLTEHPFDLTSPDVPVDIPEPFRRTSSYLQHPVFNSHHTETELLRYIHHLQSKDLSLVHSMIPLGSCTMKLNGTVEMATLTMPVFANMHPYAPNFKMAYEFIIEELSHQLREITQLPAVSLEPNSGAQGEFAGLRAIRAYHKSLGEGHRDICLIPVSAHGTNPASAAMTGMRVVPIKCDAKTGNLDVEDLRAKCEKHKDELGAIMVTYPSTFGVFEPRIREVCEIVHEYGGQVYMDGANMNAQVMLTSPGDIGADVCHLNLHKTFCIPHGGGGPGMGPVCARDHLGPFLPNSYAALPGRPGGTRNNTNKLRPDTDQSTAEETAENSKNDDLSTFAVSSAPAGSASILPISWAYIGLMGPKGLRQATEIGILNANYIMSRLKPYYPIVYTNENGRCAHEFILDVRPFRETAGVEAIDVAKRLQDYGFHAPTMSWPVPNTLMIEPTESESKHEMDRFVDALIAIREEIREVEEGRQPRVGNVLKMAPHPMHDIISGDGEGGAQWDRPYSRDKAAYPLPYLREKKFWPTVARVDDTFGDLNLFCTCPPVEDTTNEDISSVQTGESK